MQSQHRFAPSSLDVLVRATRREKGQRSRGVRAAALLALGSAIACRSRMPSGQSGPSDPTYDDYGDPSAARQWKRSPKCAGARSRAAREVAGGDRAGTPG